MTLLEIVAEPGIPQIIVLREFTATPELLLRVHTDPDLWAQWIGPAWLETTVDWLEPRDGGRWRYTHTDRRGDRYSFHGLYHGTPSGIAEQTMLGRPASLDDLGNVAAFAASDWARSLTATKLNITGGAVPD